MSEVNSVITCEAPVNIAIIKYWGKENEELNIPLNSSISLTLDMADICTRTSIAVSDTFSCDEVFLNGERQDVLKNRRLTNVLCEARKRKAARGVPEGSDFCQIASTNNFPTAAGLASSASGYACLAKCLGEAYGLHGDLSTLARLGSGSACRSMLGGFVKWNAASNTTGLESCIKQIRDEQFWSELRVIILVVNAKQKSVSSTEAMRRSVASSALLNYRSGFVVPEQQCNLLEAILYQKFETFAEITMKESNQLHAIMQDTYPPICPPYLNETSHQIIQLITCYNKHAVKAAYSFDAGPNAFLFVEEKNIQELLGTIFKHFPRGSNAKTDERNYINLSDDEVSACESVSVELDFVPIYVEDSIDNIICTRAGPGARVVQHDAGLLQDAFRSGEANAVDS